MLIVSNIFMTCAWYGHLKMKQQFSWFEHLPLIGVILFSWFLAFFEYCFQVPANRIGFRENGGPFSLIQLKVIQEVNEDDSVLPSFKNKEIVSRCYAQGVFQFKGAVPLVAKGLGISKNTVYLHLRNIPKPGI